MEPSVATLRSGAPTLSLGAWLEPGLVTLTGFLLTSVVAAADGGYFSDSWACVGLVSLVVATLRLILVPALPLRRLDWAFVLGLGAFAAWVALSSVWAPAVTPSLNETVRDASYAAVVLALLLVVRRRNVEALLFGGLLGVTLISSYTLLTRLRPDLVGDWDPSVLIRLSGPIGYWNGSGVYAAMGVLLSLGLVARSSSRVVQALAGAAPVLLMPTMLFTFSRGAWLALAAGLLAALALDVRRLQLVASALVLAVAPGVVLVLAWQSEHLTARAITLQQARDEGGSLLVWIVALSLVSGLAALTFRLLAERVRPPAAVHRALGGAVLVGAAVAAIAGFVVFGAPWTLAQRAVDSFRAVPRNASPDVTTRLLDLSSNGRVEQWRVSIDQFREHPVAGDGAGSYAAAWNLNRPVESAVQDAHSLYVEVLGELGIVGLLVLLVTLAMPFVAALRARRHPLMVSGLATYAAFLAHATVDWDWELAGVTLVALTAAAALVIVARGDREEVPPRRLVRVGLPTLTAALAILALAAVMSNVPLSQATAAYNGRNFEEAARLAQRASDWAPWSAEALDVLGRAQLAQGQVREARATFSKAVAKSPNDWVLWRDLAAAAPPEQARAAVARARGLNPRESELKLLEYTLAQR